MYQIIQHNVQPNIDQNRYETYKVYRRRLPGYGSQIREILHAKRFPFGASLPDENLFTGRNKCNRSKIDDTFVVPLKIYNNNINS